MNIVKPTDRPFLWKIFDMPGGPYSLGWTPRNDLMFHDGPRVIEILVSWKECGDFAEVTLYAGSLQRWRTPYHNEPLTQAVKEDILFHAARLLKEHDSRTQVKINWNVAE
jgi:hypothetical protein